MKRIVVIGIDGMDWPVASSLLPVMPNLASLIESGWGGEMESIFPPDSIPSWVSIFTGLDPSSHGILESIDYFKKDARQFSVDTEAFRGKTFWDEASRQGARVIVVNPLLAYPPWKINGIMASGPVFISGESAVEPPEAALGLDIPSLGGIVDFPEKKELGDFYEKTKQETMDIVEFTASLMEKEDWQLTFVTLLTMDRVAHFFWRYFDENDPTYPGPNRFSGIIPDFHAFIDRCVGRLIRAAGEEAMSIVLSDHGHAMRPPLLFNLNQLLMEKGYLESRVSGPRMLSPRYLAGKAKDIVLETLHRLDMEDISYRIARILPWTRKLKSKDYMTETSSSIAAASGFGGTNPFGGIEISKEACLGRELVYEEVREEIIKILSELEDDDGGKYFLWVARREDLYDGPSIEKYPDILYEMRPEFGTNWSVHLPLVTINPRHRKISGGHRKNSVLIAGPLDGLRIDGEALKSININATISSLTSSLTGAERPSPNIPGRSFIIER